MGDVIERVNDRREDPVAEGFDRFIGVDDLDPNELRVRRWGTIANGSLPPTFRYVFPAGSVLFPTRRPALRKCAIAPFSGITGEKILVLQSRDKSRLDSAFMPFLLASERVRRWVVQRAIGSVTPHFRWRDLAALRLTLPPLDEQRRIADVLKAMSSVADAHAGAAARAQAVVNSFLHSALTGERLGDLDFDEHIGHYSTNLNLTPIGDLLAEAQYGLSERGTSQGAYHMLRMMDLVDGVAVDTDACRVDLSPTDLDRYRLTKGDVLFNRTNSHELVGRTGVYKLTGIHVFASYLIRLRTDTRQLLPDYLSIFLNAPIGRKQVMRFATRGVSQVNVNASNLRTARIPLPSLEYQQAVMEQVAGLKRAGQALRQRAAQASALFAKTVNDTIR